MLIVPSNNLDDIVICKVSTMSQVNEALLSAF